MNYPASRHHRRTVHACAAGLLAAAILLLAIPVVHAKDPQAPAPLPIEQMRAVAYTKEFAKRFALPDPEPGTEPSGGVQAMEFAVEEAPKDAKLPLYSCKLYIHLDNKLPVSYPEGAVGAHYLPSRATYLLSPNNERWDKWSVEDRKFLNERKGLYTQRAAVATPNYVYQTRGSFNDLTYDEYHRELFPGLAYIKLDFGCSVTTTIERRPALQIWLARAGAKDYTRQLRIDSDDFMKFDLPQPLYRRISSWIKSAAAYNSKILNEDIRLHRDERMRESEKRIKEMLKEHNKPSRE